MFGTLIESRPTRQPRRGSAALSAVFHLTIVAGAVAATIQPGRSAPPAPVRRDSVIWIAPGQPAAPATRPHSVARCDFCISAPPLPQIPTHTLTIDPVPEPSFDVDSMFSSASAASGPTHGSLVDNPYARGLGSGAASSIFTTTQVDRAVAVLGSVRPSYPEMLRAAGIEGRVVVRFVVDTAGRVEAGSIATVESTHALFEQSVRDVLPRLRFAPAEVGGRRVRQLVEMPFQFSLSNR